MAEPTLGATGRIWTFFSLAMFAIVFFLYVAGELSNAKTHLHTMQKDGNCYDESELTLSVRDGESPAQFIARRHWGPLVVYWGHVLNFLFGAETHGRRLVAMGIVIASLLYMAWLARRFALLRLEETVLLAIFWSFSGALSTYTTFGLIPYPLRILSSVLLLHLVLAGYHHGFSGWRVAIPATLLALVVYFDVSCLVAVGAAAGAITLGDLRRRGFRPPALLAISVRFGLLLGPAVALALYLILGDLHPEILNPYRNLNLYFASSGYPGTILGALEFAARSTGGIIRGAMDIHPLIAAPFAGPVATFVPVGLFVLGCVAALIAYRGCSFPLAAFVVFGGLGQLLLSGLGLYPYGELRYFLPYFAVFPLFAALAVGTILRWSQERLPRHVGAGIFAVFIVILVSVQVFGVVRIVNANLMQQEAVHQGFEAMALDTGAESLVVDEWTTFTGRDSHPNLLSRPHYVLKTNLRTHWRGVAAGSADEPTAWAGFLSGKDQVAVVTSIPFNEQYMGAVYLEAKKEFEINARGQARRFYFTELRRRNNR